MILRTLPLAQVEPRGRGALSGGVALSLSLEREGCARRNTLLDCYYCARILLSSLFVAGRGVMLLAAAFYFFVVTTTYSPSVGPSSYCCVILAAGREGERERALFGCFSAYHIFCVRMMLPDMKQKETRSTLSALRT